MAQNDSASSLAFNAPIHAVFFDVDGTFYDQKKLRQRMLVRLLRHYLVRPHRLREMNHLRVFRKLRETLPERQLTDLERLQYQLPAEQLGISTAEMKAVVTRWMYEAPLPDLKACVYEGGREFVARLGEVGIPTGVYSDYPAEEKLRHMQIKVDRIVYSTEAKIDRLKPHPRGLHTLAEHFGVSPENCLFIGDRDERDGEAARRAGMVSYILPPVSRSSPDPYAYLNRHFFTDLRS